MSFELMKENAIKQLCDVGVPTQQAEILADCLTVAEMYGVTSHGIALLPAHIGRVKRGGYNLSPEINVVKETAAFAIIDGDNAIGPVCAMHCIDYGVARAKETGVFTIFSRNNNTLGPAFYYSLKAAERGCIAVVATNSPAQMAPVGGIEKLLGTNPFSVVFPVPDGEPIIIDMATSVVAKSKFKEYKEKGLKLPEGWALDRNGAPTTDPDEAMSGLVLPMAGFKGYAISMLIDVMAGVMSGAGYLDRIGRFYSGDSSSMNVGYYMTFIDPVIVCGGAYEREMREYADRIKGSVSIDNNEVVLPGEDRLKKFKENNR